MKWRLWIRDEGQSKPVEAFDIKEHDSKEAALEAAYQIMYGLARMPHRKVPYIVGPSGEQIDSEKIDA
jgi:hypothetical protein